MSKCVCMQDILKSRCKFVTLLGKYAQQKQVGWEVILSELGFAGSRVRKPRRELEGSALNFFCSLFWGFRGLQLCKKVLPKSRCKEDTRCFSGRSSESWWEREDRCTVVGRCFFKFNERLMFRSASCARHEGYEGNVSENDGPMVRLESDVRYRV